MWIKYSEVIFFFKPGGHKQHTYQHGSGQEKVDVFLGRSQSVSHLLTAPSPSSSSIQSILNWSTASPLLTEAKLLKTPLLKWSAHFTFPLRTWKCGAQILCRNILRLEASSCVEWSAVEGKVERLGREGSVRMEGPESGASERFKR